MANEIWRDMVWEYSDSYKWMSKLTKMEPLIITAAVNGGLQGKEMHEKLPEEADEIAEETYRAYNQGASIVHIHPRNPDCLWDCTEKSEDARLVNQKVREKCPHIIINNSTGGGLNTTDQGRINLLDAEPELASLNMGPDMGRYLVPERPEMFKHPRKEIFDDSCWAVTYGLIDQFVEKMNEKKIKPEMEVYHNGQYWVSRELIKNELIKPPYYFQFVMGYQTGTFPTPQNLIQLVNELPRDSIFSAIGVGKFQWAMTAMSIILGGHVRVGLEDNLYVKKGKKLRDNAHAVERIVQLAQYFGREVATPEQARDMLGISQEPKKYEIQE